MLSLYAKKVLRDLLTFFKRAVAYERADADETSVPTQASRSVAVTMALTSFATLILYQRRVPAACFY